MNGTPTKPARPVVAKPAVRTVAKTSVKATAPAKAIKKTTPTKAAVTTKSSAKSKPVKEGKASKVKASSAKPPKLIRDSFSFPENDYAMIGTLKQRALKAGCEVKKGELLRAGLALLSELSDDELLNELAGIVKLKTGRPAK